jgi:O-antigen ligase
MNNYKSGFRKKFFKSLFHSSVYLFVFSLSFEKLNILGIDLDFLFTKITIVFLFLTSILNYDLIKLNKSLLRYYFPIILYFAVFVYTNYINRSSLSDSYFDYLFFLNILIFIVLGNSFVNDAMLKEKSLIVYAFGNLLLTLIYFLGLGQSGGQLELEGRSTIFDINHNFLGLSLCLTFFILLDQVLTKISKFSYRRTLYLLSLIPLIVFIIATGSRTAFLALIIGLIIILIFSPTISKSKKQLTMISFFVILVVLWFSVLQNSFIIRRILDTINDGDTANRDLIWSSLYNLFSDKVIFGVGKSGYIRLIGDLSPHNVFLEVFLYTGVIGLLIFLTFYIRIFEKTFKSLKHFNSVLPFVFLVPITGILFTGQLFDQKVLWFIFAYLIQDFK